MMKNRVKLFDISFHFEVIHRFYVSSVDVILFANDLNSIWNSAVSFFGRLQFQLS